MSDVEKYKQRLSNKSFQVLSEQLFQKKLPNEHLMLIIKAADKDINVKELSSYLELIYKIDGFLSEISYARYVQRRVDQIHISQIRGGSVEYIIEKVLESPEAGKLVIIYFTLKFLPQIINTAADSISKFYDILLKHEDLLEKKDKRRFRKNIRDVINEEVELVNLDKKGKDKIIDLLEEIYIRNRSRVVPASRFARNYVKNIKLTTKGDEK